MQAGYNMNIKCDQNFMFCKDHDIALSVGCAGDMPSTFWDFHFTTGHYGDFHVITRWTKKVN